MNINKHEPSKDLYQKVRGGFISKGLTLTWWCRENNINPSNARSALIGSWDGNKGRVLREQLIVASGMVISPIALHQ